MGKVRVAVLFGGRSAEHEISLLSAKQVIDAIDREKYDVHLVSIDKNGEWHLRDAGTYLRHADSAKRVHLDGGKGSVALVPRAEGKEIVCYSGRELQEPLPFDVIFPVLHGTYGEDGTVQGLLKLANIPFVGAGVLGSAVGMDKDVMKRLLRDAGLPIPKFIALDAVRRAHVDVDKVVEALGLPLFVKPANLGSSVGITKVCGKEALLAAIDEAFCYDRKVLIEEAIVGREIECAVLGNEHPIASLPGEVIPHDIFYSYDAKYMEGGCTVKIPADLDPETIARFKELSVRSYQVLCCEGFARIDFFLRRNGEILINEINTIPGCTRTSVFPKLWEASGLPFPEVVDRLIQLAIDRHHKEKALKTTIQRPL